MANQFEYDALGRLKAVSLAWRTYNPQNDTFVTPDLADKTVTTYEYDEVGNQITQTDAKNQVTKFRYDAFGRRIKRILPGTQFETSTYNELGYLKTRTDFNSKTTQFEYDNMNRLVKKIPDASLSSDPVLYSYTATGQRASMKYPTGTAPSSDEVLYEYSDSDRLAKKIAPQGTIQYHYNKAGVLDKLETYHGAVISMNVAYGRDALNRVSSVTDLSTGISRVTSYEYEPVPDLTRVTLPNNVKIETIRDARGRIDVVNHLSPAGASLASFDYAVSDAGVRTSVAESISGWPSRSVGYGYDKLYRLGSESLSGGGGTLRTGTITYDTAAGHSGTSGYDAVGNRQLRTVALSPALTGLSTTATKFDRNDWIDPDTDPNNANPNYDANGNTLNAPDLAGTYAYDFENRLKSRTGGSLSTITIIYDGDGNRVRKTVGSTTTHYLVDDQNPTGYAQVLEESGTLNSAPTQVYVYGDRIVAQHRKSGSSWVSTYYGPDGNGNIRLLTDQTGAIQNRYDYDGFGTILDSATTEPNSYLYTGEQYDSDLNLYYLRARYYNPNTGRFWTSDTFEGSQIEPISLHDYLYCAADPVNRIDPSGNESLVGVMSAAAIGNSLHSLYDGVVSATGNAMQATLFGIQAGQGANDILTGFVLDETGLSLAIDGYNKFKSFFQDPEEAEIAAFMAWKEQLIATIIAAMEDNEFGEISVELVPQCFVAGTPVATESGLKSIEEIKVGDKVWAWNEATDEVTLRPVLNRFVHRRNEVFEIQVGRDSLKVTGEHPFYVSGKGWTPTRDIQVGDLFVTDDNEPLAVERIEKHQGEFLVYNFEVNTDHNYYVGEEGVLTHNANALRRAMRLTNPLLAAHHLVALRAKGAAGARALLLAPGTGILNLNDIRNGVALPKNLKVKVPGYARATVHSVVHTAKYYRELENRLRAVAPGGRIQVLQPHTEALALRSK